MVDNAEEMEAVPMEGTNEVSEDSTDASESTAQPSASRPTLRGEMKHLSMSSNPEA
jgi:hypothetical protein